MNYVTFTLKGIVISILLFCTLSLNSCILFAGYAVDQQAIYSVNLDYPVTSISQAVLDQFRYNKNVKITKSIITSEKSVIEGSVNSKAYKGTFNIVVTKLTQGSSTLQIKYDIFGDKVRSQEFLQSVKDDLARNY